MLTALEQTYVKIGRLYVQSIEFSERVNKYLEILEFAEFSDVVDFAAASGKARKKPNCNPAKSQLCGNACVSLSKKCAKETAGAKKQAADFNTKAVAAKKEKPVKEVAPKTPKAPKTATKAKKTEEVLEPLTPAPVAVKVPETTKSKAKKVEEVIEPVAPAPVAAKAKPSPSEMASIIPAKTIPIETPPKAALSVLNKHKSKIDRDLLPFLEMAQGKEPQISAADSKKSVDFLEQQTGGKIYQDTEKHKRVSEIEGMSSDEALALSHWLGVSYGPMSKRIWNSKNEKNNPNAKEYLDASILAAQALRKLPSATDAQISKGAEIRGEKYTPGQAMNRWMRMDGDQLDGFISKYEKNIGKTIVEDNFFGVSHLNAQDMQQVSTDANITYSVKSKTDGTGQGSYVEWVKTAQSEGEILYPPMSRFKVANVTKTPGPTSKDMEDARKLVDNVDLLLPFNSPDKLPKAYKKETGKTFPGQDAYEAAKKLRDSESPGPQILIELEESD